MPSLGSALATFWLRFLYFNILLIARAAGLYNVWLWLNNLALLRVIKKLYFRPIGTSGFYTAIRQLGHRTVRINMFKILPLTLVRRGSAGSCGLLLVYYMFCLFV